MRIAIVSSDPEAQTWAESLEESEFNISICSDFVAGTGELRNSDIMILDNNVAGALAVIHAYKFVSIRTTIFVRFDKEQYSTEVHEALVEIGVDGIFVDWPTAPILNNELLNRARKINFRHSRLGIIQVEEPHKLRIGESSKSEGLTQKELSIILELRAAKGKSVSREYLLATVWGYSPDVTTHTLETHIYRLRTKIDALTPPGYDPKSLLQSVDNGYALST